jgi:hypothetical protein
LGLITFPFLKTAKNWNADMPALTFDHEDDDGALEP